MWQQTHYECTSCRKSKHPSQFDTSTLQQLEQENKLYKARCYDCEKLDTGKGIKNIGKRHYTGAHTRWSDDNTLMVLCKACKKSLPVTSFSAAVQRRKDYNECEYPVCQECGTKRTTPKIGSYVCTTCLYPPCQKCGKPRPHNGKYSVHKIKIWTCAKCT